MSKEKIIYTTPNFESDIRSLGAIYKRYGKIIRSVYGPPRGGLIPAVYLSHELGVPLIVKPEKINKHTLIVDDIYDTGRTMDRITKAHKYFAVCVLWYNGDTKGKLLVQYKNIKVENQWIIFPWETLN